MMHVFHFITGLEMGGTEHMLVKLVPLLPKDKIHHVCSIYAGGVCADMLRKKGIDVIELDYRGIFTLPKVIWKFHSAIRASSPHILVTYLIQADLFGRIFGKVFGVKHIICSKRGALPQWEWVQFFDRITRFLVDRYVAVSQTLAQKMIRDLKISAEDIIVIPNGLDLHLFGDMSRRKTLRKEMGLGDRDKVVGIVSKLRPGKGHEELFQATSDLIHNGVQDTKIIVVGDGPSEEPIRYAAKRSGAEEHILFLGLRNDIPDLLNVFDLFVLPTYAEGMSNVLLEAMAAGCAIITTSIPENRELFIDGQQALLVPPKEVKALSYAMRQLLSDSTLREKLKNAAKKRAADFSLESVSHRFDNLLNSLCSLCAE